MKNKDQEQAVFWCSILRPLIYGEIPRQERYAFLKSVAKESIKFPNGTQKCPSLSTLKRKLAIYSDAGFEALARKPRSDRGTPRKVSTSVIESAVAVKCDQGKRSAHAVNLFLKEWHNITLPHSTLYRHLRAHGATKLKLGLIQKKVRCRWTREKPNQLWVGDFSDGPCVLTPEANVVRSYLSLFIDCSTRYVVEGRYYLRESFDILIDSLLRAWSVHGLSEQLYLDNAKIYHANALKSACFSLRINLIHRTAGDPSPGGLVEKLFGTNQSQFEAEVRAGDILTLNQLNRAFQAWLHHYHHTVHSETKHTPQDLYSSATKRRISIQEAVMFFMQAKNRTVHRDFSDISLDGRLYAVDPRLRGDKVQVRFDPYSSEKKVLIYSLDDRFLGEGRLYSRDEKNRTPEISPKKKPIYNYIELIINNHDQYLKNQTRAIDYAALPPTNASWPLSSFISTVAELLGQKDGTCSFSTAELETLKKLYQRHQQLTKEILRQAFADENITTIGGLALSLQNLKNTHNKEK